MVNDCHQECINTIGSFTCECLEGFVLNSDNRTCSGIQYPLVSNLSGVSLTSKMVNHRGVSLGKQCIADLMFCHGPQTIHDSRICHCLLFHEQGKQNFM